MLNRLGAFAKRIELLPGQPGHLRIGPRGHGLQVVRQIADRHGRERHAVSERGNPVNHERGLGEHDVVLRGAESAHGKVEQLVRAVALDDVRHRHAMLRCDALTQPERVRVGVAMHVVQRGARRGEGFRARTERVFVGGELDRIRNAELTRELLDGLTALVREQRLDRRRYQGRHRGPSLISRAGNRQCNR